MAEETGKAFDFKMLKRLLHHTKPYRTTFYGVVLAAILLSAFAVLSPILLREIVNTALVENDGSLLLNLIILMLVIIN